MVVNPPSHRHWPVRPVALALLLVSFLLIFATAVTATALSGSQQGGTHANGEGYRLFALTDLADVSTVTVMMTAGTGYIAMFTADQGTTTPLPTVEETPPWHVAGTRPYVVKGTAVPVATFTLSPARHTKAILVLSRMGNGEGGPIPIGMAASSAAIAPWVQPKTLETALGGTATSANGTTVCTDPGDGAVDQNGVSVDVRAPGVRRACGFMGYENGDNPMPPGTPFDIIRPFRFDSNYDHNEAVYGFKVFYYHGDPTTHCGDVREVLHQGGGTKGFAEEYHTYQVAIAQCSNNADRATMHILDVGGQADLGCLVTRTEFNATGEICQRTHTPGSQGERITADTRTCHTAIAGADCITTWYPTISFSGPNGVSGGVETTLIVNDPISLVDPTDITRVVKTNDYAAGANGQYNGVKRGMSLLLVYGVSSSTSQRWSSVWDATSHKQVPVPAGTAGSWPMRVDAGFHADAAGVTMQFNDERPSGFGDHTGTEGASTQRHSAPVSTGIVYPN